MITLGKAASLFEAKTGIGVDGVHSNALSDLSDECGKEIWILLQKLEMAVKP